MRPRPTSLATPRPVSLSPYGPCPHASSFPRPCPRASPIPVVPTPHTPSHVLVPRTAPRVPVPAHPVLCHGPRVSMPCLSMCPLPHTAGELPVSRSSASLAQQHPTLGGGLQPPLCGSMRPCSVRKLVFSNDQCLLDTGLSSCGILGVTTPASKKLRPDGRNRARFHKELQSQQKFT